MATASQKSLSCSAQFVEPYNPTSTIVNIVDWKVSTTHGGIVTMSIQPASPCCGAVYIPAKGHYVVIKFTKWLANEDESIILRDATGKEIDRTPVKSDPYDDARSWQRNPDGKDTDTDADWVFQTSTYGLPIPEFPSASMILAVTLLTVLITLRNQKRLITKKIGNTGNSGITVALDQGPSPCGVQLALALTFGVP